MISIQSSLNELDKAHQLREGLLDCYLNAIKNSANYAIDLDDEGTAIHRRHLRALAEDVSTGDTAIIIESRSTLRGLLRDFRDKGAQYLATLRDELSSTARALEEILDSLSQCDGEHEGRLRHTIQNLREIAGAPKANGVSNLLRSAATTIEQSVEQMRKQHQVTVSQFQIEIRMLHKRIDSLESAASVDDLTQLFNRAEMEKRIQAAKPGQFCLLLVTVRGLRRADTQFGPPIAEELAGAFAKRLRNSLPPQALIARWGHEEFVVMVNVTRPEAVASGKWMTEHLSGAYACLNGGKTVRPTLQLNVGVVDTAAGEAVTDVLNKIGTFLTGS
jgi:diguanylate cyclase (GGDEF)-like protein